MRKSAWIVVSIFLVLVLILTACSSSSPPTQEPTATNAAVTTTEEVPTQLPTAEPEITEQPVETSENEANAYPVPVIEHVPYDPYPSPVAGEEIDWSKVPDLLKSGQVGEVFQRYAQPIVITLKDGRIYLVTAPENENIFMLLDECGQPCNVIRRKSDQ